MAMPRSGNTTARGYGAAHQAERKRYAEQQARGVVLICWRCRQPIIGKAWDLGHDDARTMVMGPEHRHQTGRCPGNRSDGTTRGNRKRARSRRRSAEQSVTASRW